MSELAVVMDCATCAYGFPVYDRDSGLRVGVECNVNNLVFIPSDRRHSCGRWTEADE